MKSPSLEIERFSTPQSTRETLKVARKPPKHERKASKRLERTTPVGHVLSEGHGCRTHTAAAHDNDVIDKGFDWSMPKHSKRFGAHSELCPRAVTSTKVKTIIMAGVLEEFDEATPLKGTFCSRLSVEEYEEQASACTEQALRGLMAHLDKNPEEFKTVLRKRKLDEEEEGSMWAFVKVCTVLCQADQIFASQNKGMYIIH